MSSAHDQLYFVKAFTEVVNLLKRLKTAAFYYHLCLMLVFLKFSTLNMFQVYNAQSVQSSFN